MHHNLTSENIKRFFCSLKLHLHFCPSTTLKKYVVVAQHQISSGRKYDKSRPVPMNLMH